jgi:hypothetical protein
MYTGNTSPNVLNFRTKKFIKLGPALFYIEKYISLLKMILT